MVDQSQQRAGAVKENKMGTKAILPLLISMSLPPMFSMFLQYTYNAVDCMFVSWLSQDALTAVSLAFPLTTLILSISIGVGVGTNALIARALGEKNQEKANSIVNHSLILSFFLSILLTILTLFIAKPFYEFFTDSNAIFQLGLDYTYVVAFMVLGNMVHIAIQKIIQATGNMMAPMFFQMAGVVLNFILDPLLIFGLLGFPAMGVKGAAIATVAGYLLSMFLAFYVLLFTKQKVAVQRKDFYLDKGIFKEIIITGLPSLIMNALGALMVVFANIFLVTYSMTAVAFFGVYFKIQQLIVMTVNGLIQGCMPIMSYNFGAQNRTRLMKTFKTGTWMAMVLMGIGMFLLWIVPVPIMSVFNASAEMMDFGVAALRIMSASYVLGAVGVMFASFYQATGRMKHSLFLNILRQLLLLVPFMYLGSSLVGISGIWWAFIWAEAITAGICILLFYQTEMRLTTGSMEAFKNTKKN